MSDSKKKKRRKRDKVLDELKDTYKPCKVEIDMEMDVMQNLGNLDRMAANQARIQVGLDPLEEHKERKCLRCGGMFMTTKSIRICCVKSNELPEGWDV